MNDEFAHFDHETKMRLRIGSESADAQILYDYAVELAAQGRDKAAARVHAKAEERDAEAAFLRTRLSNYQG